MVSFTDMEFLNSVKAYFMMETGNTENKEGKGELK